MNLIIGASNTVHNDKAIVYINGVATKVPTCSVSLYSNGELKRIVEVDHEVTCKTCLKSM